MIKSITAALALAATFAAADLPEVDLPEVKVCPVNEVFKACGTACERTCFNVLQPKPVFCTFQCISECQCDTGYVRSTATIDGKKGECVLESECRASTTPFDCSKSEQSCNNAEVPSYCRPSCPTVNSLVDGECAPYKTVGQECGGFLPECKQDICSPGLNCVTTSELGLVDMPGVCSKCTFQESQKCLDQGGRFDAKTCECVPPPPFDSPFDCSKSEQSCNNAEVPSYCRPSCPRVNSLVDGECAPYKTLGQECGGFLPECERNICSPGLSCITSGLVDLPGVCSKCNFQESQKCAAKGGRFDAKTCDCVKPPVATCESNGNTYLVGESYNDGCNNCVCEKGGIPVCTKKFCPPSTCESNGNTYLVGDKYKDGCNDCVCGKGGVPLCTKKFCPPPTCEHLGQTYLVGDKYKDDCNDCVCGKGGVATCTEKVCQACEHEYKLCQADWQCMVALWSPRATCTGRKKCQPAECAIDSSCEPFLCTSEEKCVSEPQHAPIGRCVILGDDAIIEGL